MFVECFKTTERIKYYIGNFSQVRSKKNDYLFSSFTFSAIMKRDGSKKYCTSIQEAGLVYYSSDALLQSSSLEGEEILNSPALGDPCEEKSEGERCTVSLDRRANFRAPVE